MRILLVTQSLPWPLRRNGGAQRTTLLIDALRAWGHVDVIGVGGDERIDTADEQAMARELCLLEHFDTTPASRPKVRAPWPLKPLLFQREDWARRYRPQAPIVEWIADVQRGPQPYHLIVGRYLKAAAKAGLLASEGGTVEGARVILDFDDLDHQLFRSHRESDPWPGLGGRLATGMVRRQLARISHAAPSRVAATWVCSEEDAAELQGASTVRVLPNVPYHDGSEPAPTALPSVDESKTILFVGDLTFPSNRDGVARFVAEVWPLVRAAVPEASLELVGKVHAQDRAGIYKAAGVNVAGYVDDLVAAYRRSAFSVAPIWTGGGTKIKVIESLAYGRPCVTTTHCLRGYGPLIRAGVLDGTDQPQPMAAACVRLLRDAARRADIGTRGASLARQHYSFDAFRTIVGQTVQTLLPDAVPETSYPGQPTLAGGAK